MPYKRTVICLQLAVDLVLVLTCVFHILGQNVSFDMSDKDNTESEGCIRKNLKAFSAAVTLFVVLVTVSLFTFLSWVYVHKVPRTPYSREGPRNHLFSYGHKYSRPGLDLGERKSVQRSEILSNNDMRLYVVQAGLLTGAVCLDGSPPAYYLRKGRDLGAHRWIIHFNGGAWCFDESACLERSRSSLGSSKNLPASPPVIQGLNSPDPQVNPDFFDWNLVWVVYCDGASFTGNRDGPVNVDGEFIYFRGKRIIDAVFEDLLLRGFDNAERLILTGSSAGSMTALFTADHIARKFAPSIPVRVMSDAGFFVETSSMGGKNVGAMFKQIYDMQNSSSGLNEGCIRTYGVNHGWRCFLPETTFRFIRTPTFILNAAYDVWALIYFMGINCKFPSNSYSREKRGIDLILPYLRSSKRNTPTRGKWSKTIPKPQRKIHRRDISGFEILPFFRGQLTDRESLPIYQPFDEDTLYDPSRNQESDRNNDNAQSVMGNSYNTPPYTQPIFDPRLQPDRNLVNPANGFENNGQPGNEFVDEQAGRQSLDGGQISPPFVQQGIPTANPFLGQKPTQTPMSDQGNYLNSVNQLSDWPDKLASYNPQANENPTFQNGFSFDDLSSDISQQTVNGKPAAGLTPDFPESLGLHSKPVSPFDSLVNSLKNLTRKKAENKNLESNNDNDDRQKLLDGNAGKAPGLQRTVQHLNGGDSASQPKRPAKVVTKSGNLSGVGKTFNLVKKLKQTPANRSAGTNHVLSTHFRVTNDSLEHTGPVLKSEAKLRYFNASKPNRTENKGQNKRSTNIAKEYISILRSDPPECTDTDMVDVMKYRETMLKAIEVVRGSPRSGVFLVSCIDHSLSLFDETWSTIIVNGKSIAQAFGDWYFSRPTNHNDIDCPYPCNPSCP